MALALLVYTCTIEIIHYLYHTQAPWDVLHEATLVHLHIQHPTLTHCSFSTDTITHHWKPTFASMHAGCLKGSPKSLKIKWNCGIRCIVVSSSCATWRGESLARWRKSWFDRVTQFRNECYRHFVEDTRRQKCRSASTRVTLTAHHLWFFEETWRKATFFSMRKSGKFDGTFFISKFPHTRHVSDRMD